MENEKIIAKIKKLLALSNNNTNEQEANSALLKAQQLMVENDISIDVSIAPNTVEYETIKCTHKWNMGFKGPLANIISANFRCKMYYQGGTVTFMGHKLDARIAKEAFEYAYDFALREGNRHYNKAYQMGTVTKGVFNSYTLGFMRGLKMSFDKQCTALIVITPTDVIQKFEDMTKDWKVKKGGMGIDQINRSVYDAGVLDGKTIMNGRRLHD
jgi:hypothetical protein